MLNLNNKIIECLQEFRKFCQYNLRYKKSDNSEQQGNMQGIQG